MGFLVSTLKRRNEVTQHRELVNQMLDALINEQQLNALQDITVDSTDYAITAACEYLAAPEQSEPIGYMNAGHVYELQQKRTPYGYVYPNEGVGADVAVYATPQPTPPEPVNQMLLEDALVYVATAGHDTSIHMLPKGVTLFDNDGVQVKLPDGRIAHAGRVSKYLVERYKAAGQAPQPTELTSAEVLVFAKEQAANTVDYDFAGNPITDAEVMMFGAFGPLITRTVNAVLAAQAQKGTK